MLPWKSIIHIDRGSKRPVYLQVVNAVVDEILEGRLSRGQKMPGTRTLSEALDLNRKTIGLSYDELVAQGWLEIVPSRGTFIGKTLPLVKQRPLPESHADKQSGFISSIPAIDLNFRPAPNLLDKRIDDGSPDYRMAPIDQLIKTARFYAKGRIGKSLLLNRDPLGEAHLRHTLSKFLANTRAIHGQPDQVLITRGSQMAIYLIFRLLLKRGEKVVVSELNYLSANRVITEIGGQLITVPVEKDGICVDEIERQCRQSKIRAIYITPHHHFPTTVMMSAEKRIKLLELSKKYSFAIIEDDYDYDYHYQGSPILPLASLDKTGNVIYIGSFGKMLAPSVRIGYMFAHPKIALECANLRRMIDKVGDPIMERAISQLIEDNELQRCLKKAVKAYRHRRDLFSEILTDELTDYLSFEKPEGGMAIWAKWKHGIETSTLVDRSRQAGLSLDVDEELSQEACRLGFASLNEVEIKENLQVLKSVLQVY